MISINRLLSYAILLTVLAPLAELSASELAKSMKKQQALSRSIRSNIKNKNWVAATDEIQQFFEAYKKNSRLRANVLALSQELADAYTKPGTLPYDSKLVTGKRDLKNLGMAKDAIVTAINAGQFADALAGIKKLETAKYNPLEIAQLYKALVTQVNKAEKTGAPAPAPSPLDPSEILIKATGSGDLSKVKEALAAGADINARNKNKSTALMIASYRGYQDIVQHLLQQGAKVDLQDAANNTALIIASHEGRTKIVQLLLKADADTTLKDEDGKTALYYAEDKGYSEIVTLLKAAETEHEKEEKEEKEAVEVSQLNNELIQAAKDNNLEKVKKALAAGANVDAKSKKAGLEAVSEGLTALMLASANRNTNMIKHLLQKNANVDIQSKIGFTALIIASNLDDYTDGVKQLLDAGANTDLKDIEGKTALDHAEEQMNLSIITLLKAAGAKESSPPSDFIHQRNKKLLEAAEKGDSTEFANLMRSYIGADMSEVKNEDGETPLILASKGNHINMVQTLLLQRRKVNPDTQDSLGTTALIEATRLGHKQIVEMLLNAGANPTLQDNIGKTALDYAEDHPEIKALLTSKMASPTDDWKAEFKTIMGDIKNDPDVMAKVVETFEAIVEKIPDPKHIVRDIDIDDPTGIIYQAFEPGPRTYIKIDITDEVTTLFEQFKDKSKSERDGQFDTIKMKLLNSDNENLKSHLANLAIDLKDRFDDLQTEYKDMIHQRFYD